MFGKKEFEAKRFLRVVFDNEYSFEQKGLYPEIFDCTFNFAPRMCDANGQMCMVCPYNEQADKFEKLCIKQKEKICPVVMVCCGYQKECDGDDCKLLTILGEN